MKWGLVSSMRNSKKPIVEDTGPAKDPELMHFVLQYLYNLSDERMIEEVSL